MQNQIDWKKALKPLLKKYKGQKHPLEYKNTYQLLVMVVLSAQDSDKNINNVAPELFKAFPNIAALSRATPEVIYPYVSKVRGYVKKTNWLLSIATQIKKDKDIPLTLDALVKLQGIGRKSANVIMREAGAQAEGVMVDLHVVRVAQRIGITNSDDPKKIEQDIMNAVPQKDWGDVGMALSFLGREICRPSHPEHGACVLAKSCAYYQQLHRDGNASLQHK